jgi:hypothetical protein
LTALLTDLVLGTIGGAIGLWLGVLLVRWNDRRRGIRW